MIEFENKIFIERPVEEVFAFVSDFENVPKWNYYVLEVNKTSAGPVEAGTTYHQIRKTDEQDFGVTEYEPPERVVVRTLPHAQPAFEMRFTFQVVEGGTQVTDEWKLDTGRPGFLERLGTGRVKQAVKANLSKLKELLETGRVQLQDGRTAVR